MGKRNIADILEIAYHRAKGSEIGIQGDCMFEHACDTFHVVVFNVILSSFSALLSKMPRHSKTPTLIAKQKCGIRGLLLVHTWGVLVPPKAIFGHLLRKLFGIQCLCKFTSVTPFIKQNTMVTPLVLSIHVCVG